MTAPVMFHAETFVSLVAVRGGVLDAPRSRDCRGWLGADVWRGRLYLRQPRRASLASTAPRMQYRGHSPRTILHGRTEVVLYPTPGGRGSPPLRNSWNVSARNRRCPSTEGGASGTPPLTGGLFTLRCGIHRKGTARAPFFTGVRRCPSTKAGRAWKPSTYGRHPPLTNVGRNPSVTALCAATAPLSGEPRCGREAPPFASFLP